MTANAGLPHFVYVCRNSDDVVLYVGCTVNPKQREGAHTTGTWWWEQVADVAWTYCRDMSAGRAEELLLIKQHLPTYNQQGIPRDRAWREARDTERNAWYATANAPGLARSTQQVAA